MNPQNWKLIKSNGIVKNEFGKGINIYECKKPIYIPILSLEEEKLDFVNINFYNAFKTYILFSSKPSFGDIEKKIKELSNKHYCNLEYNKKGVGDYLELLILRDDYVNFYPKNPNFKLYDALLNSNSKFNIPFLNLIKYFDKLNEISYTVHNLYSKN